MTRVMKETGSAYRAVITERTDYGEGDVREATRYEGPYATKAAATARITRAVHENEEWGLFSLDAEHSVTGYVEKSTTTWERV